MPAMRNRRCCPLDVFDPEVGLKVFVRSFLATGDSVVREEPTVQFRGLLRWGVSIEGCVCLPETATNVWGKHTPFGSEKPEWQLSDVLNCGAPGVGVSKPLHEWQPVREVASCVRFRG